MGPSSHEIYIPLRKADYHCVNQEVNKVFPGSTSLLPQEDRNKIINCGVAQRLGTYGCGDRKLPGVTSELQPKKGKVSSLERARENKCKEPGAGTGLAGLKRKKPR